MSKNLDIVRLVEAAFRLTASVDSGVLLSPSSSIVSYSFNDPYQSKSREYYKYYNTAFALSSAKDSSFSRTRSLRLALQEADKKEELYWEL